MRSTRFFVPVGVLLLTASEAWAQPVPSREPSSTHIFPAGGRRGTTVQVRVGAECLPPGAPFHLYGAGATAPTTLGPRVQARYEPSPRRNPTDADGGERIAYAKEWQSQITIAGDAPLGPILWRATCGFGGTQPRPFVIGDWPEWIETEPNSTPDRAQRLTLPITVNGQIAGERDVDCYAIAAKAGDVVTCDVLAARLGSPLEPAIEVHDPQKRRLSVQEVRSVGDPMLAFCAEADGVYTLSIANLGYRGGPEYVYRLNLTTAPYAVFAFPPGGRVGESREMEFFALSGHVGESLRDSRSRLGETRPRDLAPRPGAVAEPGAFRRWKEVVTFPSARSSARFSVHGVPLEVGDANEWVARNDRERTPPSKIPPSEITPSEITPPVAVSGRLLTPTSEDVYVLRAKKDATFAITCSASPAASQACPVIAVEDAAGGPLAKTPAAEAAERRGKLEWKAPADGQYRLRVRDLAHGSRGGADFIYRLLVRPAEPDFAITLAADYVNVVQGGRTELDGVVERSGGFVGPITLQASGLPEGARFEPPTLAPNQVAFKLVLTAAEDARPTSGKVQIVGEAAVGGRALRRSATFSPLGGRDGLCGGLPCDALYLTVQHRPVFRLNCNEAYQYAHRGTVHAYKLEVERLHGFAGPIVLQICDRQVQDLDGIEVVEQTIPPTAKKAAALIYLPETMHANVQHHCRPYVQGCATFTDRWGQRQAMLAVCEKRCMIRTMPAVVKLKTLEESLSLHAGGEAVCRLALERTSNFAGAMEVELIDPPAGLTATKARIEAGASHAALTLQAGAKLGQGQCRLKFRATGLGANNASVITEAEIRLSVP